MKKFKAISLTLAAMIGLMTGNDLFGSHDSGIPIKCEVSYYSEKGELGKHAFFAKIFEKGAPISEDFTILGIKANLHVYFVPESNLISINYYYEPMDSYLNGDLYIQRGKLISLVSRNLKLPLDYIERVGVNCLVD